MKYKEILLYIVVILFLSSCEKSFEVDRILMSSAEKELAPYQQNDNVSFLHSNGYKVNFKVSEVKYVMSRSYENPNLMFQSGNYVAFQMKQVTLNATYPKITIKIDLGYTSPYAPAFNDSGEVINLKVSIDSVKLLRVTFNNYYASINYNKNLVFNCKDDSTTCYDSILIGGKTYFNVVETKFYYHSNIKDASPKSFLYNKHGLLQIKLCNDETFSIK